MIALLGIALVVAIVSAIPIAIGKKRFIKLNAKKRKGWLLSHILFVILYISGLLGTLLLVLFARSVSGRELIYAVHVLILYFDWFLIIPGSLGSLFTGFWLAVGNWGITRHYWVIAKWVGTIAAILFGGTVVDMWVDASFHAASSAGKPLQDPDFRFSWMMMLISCAVVLANALFLVVISYLKPWGKRKNSGLAGG